MKKIAQKILPKGLNVEIIKQISETKNEPKWLFDWRLRAFSHWQKMSEPNWAKLKMKPINYQKISYQALPKNYNSFSGNQISNAKIQKLEAKINQIKAKIEEINQKETESQKIQ